MENQKIAVEFTKEHFFTLMKAVYLGNWMANATRAENRLEEYEQILDYVFSLTPKFNLEKYLDHDKTDDSRYFPTAEFEETTGIEKIQNEYDSEVFWDELAERLGERDFVKKYGEAAINKMGQEERFNKLYDCIDKWSGELETRGIDRLQIKE
jgi:uncharacterized membrane-anchored protein YjiN (DUF445 family)